MTFLARGRRGLQAGFPKDDVDAAWARPPRSSEQILHPEKYWTRRDATIRSASRFRTRPPSVGKGWARPGSGVLGELTLGMPRRCENPEAAAIASSTVPWTNAAASGWGGDRYEVWTKGDSVVVLLATVWDTETDAAGICRRPSARPANFAVSAGRAPGRHRRRGFRRKAGGFAVFDGETVKRPLPLHWKMLAAA
jgi:hypothetical protein